jgi:beta-galactosidase/beta-glucuronidase
LASLTIRTVGLGILATLCATVAEAATGADASGQSATRPLLTTWGEQLDKSDVLPEYPRPQMVRDAWTNLNGEWDFAISPADGSEPKAFDKKIVVPFPVESVLSGVASTVKPEDAVWYRRTFDPGQGDQSKHDGQRVLLHFGAVDWQTKVWVNGVEVGEHTGGYDPFSFDITKALSEKGPQTLVVRVTDPTNRGSQPHGKQSLEPGGIVYTAVTGIWQTVWLETVPATRIRSLKVTPHVESGEVEIVVDAEGPGIDKTVVRIATKSVSGTPLRVTGKPGEPLRLVVPKARLWSPEDPYLYDLEIDLAIESGKVHNVIDQVSSYFGMRSVAIVPDEAGHSRICLIGK